MANDLAHTPTTGIPVQAVGDAHIGNFGMFRSPSDRLVFDINDFDETTTGPWEWDVKRLAVSVEICGRANGIKEKDRRNAVARCVHSYRDISASSRRWTSSTSGTTISTWRRRSTITKAR